MSKTNTTAGKTGARKAGKGKGSKAPPFVPHFNADAGNADAIRDALRGRHVNRFGQLSRTRAIHEALYSAYEAGEGRTARQIAEQATALMLAADAMSGGNGLRSDGQAIMCRAVGAHLNTMKKAEFGREYLERRADGLYWLTPIGAAQCKLELSADDRARLNAYLKAQKVAFKGKAPADDKPKTAKKARKGRKAEHDSDDDAGE